MLGNYLSAENAAKRIGCTVGRVYQLFREGELKGERLHARGILLDPKSVEQYALRPQATGRPRVASKGRRTTSENS